MSRTAPSDNDKSCRADSRGWLLDLFDLIFGFFLLGVSILIGLYGLPYSQTAFGVAVLVFAGLVFILAWIFIYDAATKPTILRAFMTKDESPVATTKEETGPQAPRTQSVKVTYAPTTELVVHEIIEQDQTTFFEDIIRQMPVSAVHVEPIVNWVNGFALLTTQFPRTAEIIADNLAGKIHYQTVVFTKIPFHNKINLKIEGQDFSVRLKKADDNPNLVDLAVFLEGFKPRTSIHVWDSSAAQ
jgi:hypothetical protein